MFHSIINRSSTIVLDDIKIRLISSQDVAKITTYYQKNRDFLKAWEPTRNELFFLELGWQKRVEQIATLHRHEMAFYFVIEDRSTDEIIGVINYSNLVKFPFHACHVGYSLDQDYQGRAIMRRALKETVNWMFEVKGFHRIMAAYMPHNKRSASVLHSVGFEEEGLAKAYLLIDGKWQDHVLTSLINQQWTAPATWSAT
ncbi:ribosomal-protein-alanine acetyltransferase [Photobacterium angustum]|uniref:30S ribosomal protein S5 alanine N-acetyltransferase n=1 Tax=Photobacterium angustum TaxID=661 RepID=A0ABX5H9I5_PHOAN|nr:ribosomal protein S5-alanine N-acetyltransferase [Photobacterium angustum]KJG40573.1 ribosomal-protein-alanine acetyltransferase [Photobacterium angustum]PSX12756.1 30S ribosomal protein S5 alanine N-acetyltransferase [Photobacterium angustum]